MRARITLAGRARHCATVLIFAFASLAIPAQAQIFSPPINVTKGVGPNGPARVAVDSNGNVDLVWPQGEHDQTLLFARSTDGGKTFGAPTTVWTADGTFGVGIAHEVGGGLQILVDGTGNINLFWARSYYDANANAAGRRWVPV